jgi:Spirocyclase AveC-like
VSDLPETMRPVVTESLDGAAPLDAAPERPVGPVQIWAVIGGALLVLQLYVWIRWVTGPYFERVPAGPSDPPMFMKVPLMANAIVLWVALPFALWWFIVRPWLRERRITLDGMLLVSMALMFFQDPLLNYFNTLLYLQHLAFQQRFVVIPHTGLGLPGGTRPPGRRTSSDERAGLRIRRTSDHHCRLLGHAQDQSALARHQQSSVDTRHLRTHLPPRLRHGGSGSAAHRVLDVSRCDPRRLVQRGHLPSVAHLRRG